MRKVPNANIQAGSYVLILKLFLWKIRDLTHPRSPFVLFMKLYFYLIISLLLISACGETGKEPLELADGQAIEASNIDSTGSYIGYRFNEPDEVYTMPGSLTELSGMQYLSIGLIACVQDEKGTIYLFDREKKQLVKSVHWGKRGDYEGIAGDEQTLYVLESTGTVYKVSNYLLSESPEVEALATGLPKACDAEGLFLLENDEKLLIACKGGELGVRDIWAYDLQKKVLEEKPFISLSQERLESHFITTGLDRFSLVLKKLLDAKGESGILAPSGIAQHPNTRDVFVVSANSNLLLIFNPAGELISLEELSAKLFAHPESITFTEDGGLLIGNEGKGVAPTILYFNYDKTQ